ncbi:MAG: inositol monophosphatase [Acidobacteria bacterium]|nr:inositol monophosphatase [Acidobacteriota bacterium]
MKKSGVGISAECQEDVSDRRSRRSEPIDRRRALRVAVAAATAAGDLLQSRFGRKQTVRHKGTIDIVTDMDHRSQDLILGIMKEEFPEHDTLSEEMPPAKRQSKYLWVIDPLDGTTNYAHGFPMYCVSIGLMRDDRPILGVVYCPTMKELFTAVRGEGARLNGSRIRVSRISSLDQALLATGFPYDIRTSRDNNLAYFRQFARSAQAVRRAGSAALDLSYVAAGRFDGFWEIKLKRWDIAAGILMVKEAGGHVTDFSGGEVDFEYPRVLASNGRLHQSMLKVLATTRE